MKKYLRYAIVAVLVFVCGNSFAQKGYRGKIEFSEPQISKQTDQLDVELSADLSDIRLKSQQMITFTPMLVSSDSTCIYTFPPTIVSGGRRLKAVRRAVRLGSVVMDPEPRSISKHRNGSKEVVSLSYETDFEPWMRDARLVLAERVSGCLNCEILYAKHDFHDRILPPLFVPQYRLAYITPPVEEVKRRSESHAAMLNFVVDKYELLRDYKNNAQVLGEVDKIIGELMNDPNLTITKFTVTGYASPEGNYNRNMVLSRNRALALVDYLKSQFGFNDREVETAWGGEDWPGLRKVVAASDLADKEQILAVIDIPDVAQRKRKLQSMPIYRSTLLPDFYPPLRRNEYTVEYVGKAFNIEEAKVQIRTRPHLLSLNEMFLVANTYPKDSEEFKQVFDIATRLFPDSPIARMNAAALDIETGALDTGLARMQGLELPETYNNIGVACIKKGDYDNAEENFRKAAAMGDATARYNLEQLEQWKLND